MRIALLGGSFNPPHLGHLSAALSVIATREVDRVWLMPAFRHPFGKSLASFDDRVAMCARACQLFAPGTVEVTRVEEEVGGRGRTVEALRFLHAQRPDDAWSLIIGSDILDEAAGWYQWEEIRQLADLIVVPRGGHPHPEARGPVMPEVSSTEVRRRLQMGQDCSALVPRGVLDYVRDHALYR